MGEFGNIQELEKGLIIRKNSVNKIQNYIMNECNNPHEAFVLSKTYLSSQSYGGVLESFYKRFFHLSKIKESQDGDLNSTHIGNVEVKVSIQHNVSDVQFCMMQLRPAHNVDYYLGVFYSFTESSIKYILAPSSNIKDIIEKYCGSYSHGTKTGKGKPIRKNWEKDTEAEFQFSFQTNPSKRKPYKIWSDLKSFVYSEQELINKLK
tara:strand:+ start:55 stop:672 length:618 start_codon:yes stop_codon:yes gene_type:complete